MIKPHILLRAGFIAFDSLHCEKVTNTRIVNLTTANIWVRFTWRVLQRAARWTLSMKQERQPTNIRNDSTVEEMVTNRAVESEPEGFSTWGDGVAENFNDSNSGQTFCSPIMTVYATNVRKRHTWQFKQLDASTRDDHGYSDRWQRTNLHTYTQGPFQISSVPWAHHATYNLWMQPFGACITEIFICSFWLALSLLRDVGLAPMNESSHGRSSIVT